MGELNEKMAAFLATVPKFLPDAPGAKLKGLEGFTCGALYGSYAAPRYLIKGALLRGEMVVKYGESGVMKSFAAIDWAMSIGAGIDWCGMRVHQTGVLYVCAEGAVGAKKRFRAWLLAHGYEADDVQPAVYVAIEPANLMMDPDTIRATIAKAEAELERAVDLVVFDTLAANFGPGDESRTEDMQIALRNVRAACGERAVLLVHHVGHGDKTRERGSYSLIAAADRRILVERPETGDQIVLTCKKAKDDEPFPPIALRWRKLPIGWRDADGDELTSVVLEPTGEPVPSRGKVPGGPVQKAVLIALKAAPGGMKKLELVALLRQQGIPKRSVYDACDSLQRMNLIAEGMQKLVVIDA